MNLWVKKFQVISSTDSANLSFIHTLVMICHQPWSQSMNFYLNLYHSLDHIWIQTAGMVLFLVFQIHVCYAKTLNSYIKLWSSYAIRTVLRVYLAGPEFMAFCGYMEPLFVQLV